MRPQYLQRFQSRFQNKIAEKLNKKIRFTIESLTQFTEELSDAMDDKSAKGVLNFALDSLKPVLGSLGLRIVRLSDENIEVKLPLKFHTSQKILSEEEEVDEGLICSAAIFAFRQLWIRNAPKGKFLIRIKKINFEKIAGCKSDLALRFEVSHLQRETLFTALTNQEVCECEYILHVYNQAEQIVAEVQIVAEMSLIKSLEWK